jgi:superfamily II DNA or RNA helicase
VAKLEDLKPGARVRGIRGNETVEIIEAKWHGGDIVELTFRTASGKPDTELLFRDREASLEVQEGGPRWSYMGDGGLFRLVSEARRIQLAHLFDPLLAVHTSLVEPLPHQITAVYGEMIRRQPLRFLLADDPGAGKTIMAGLFIKELIARGDVQRCMIVCPGVLVEQWQDELDQKFGLPFEILTNDNLEAARTGNWFTEHDLVICRLDKLSRDEDVQAKLQQVDWDLVVVDEAHKMSASYFASEVKETKRYKLGKALSRVTRHFLLMTATPHNGKDADFQLFMALLDGDRFEGKFRDGHHSMAVSDLMRRMVKEDLLRFDGTKLFPERIAKTITYTLSDVEARLYREVTDYVRTEFNRADKLETGRKGTVGFALTILQRRLASSPEAIYQSLSRRRKRLEERLRDTRVLARGQDTLFAAGLPSLTDDDLDDLEDAPGAEQEAEEERIVDQATAARSVPELEAELARLRELEALALTVRRGGTDRKWDELRTLLADKKTMFDDQGRRLKLVIFTEHRDTLTYLQEKIGDHIGRREAVVTIHGRLGREERKKAEESFRNDPETEILLATDAAGEGINLQRAHLMVNYDLPWNPNRLEQRFGRIHRIGQREVCHLWNLVAHETREGEVFVRLFEKLEEERKALGGRVFDVLGQIFRDTPLRDLLVEAIRYADTPEARARMRERVDGALDREQLQALLEEHALARDSMDVAAVHRIREEMERADARRLQPHFIGAYFVEAFRRLGGRISERERGRYEVAHVPALVRGRDRVIGRRVPVLPRYERITFEKKLVSQDDRPPAAFVCPGHPLLESVSDLVLEQHRGLLREGTVLVDDTDPGTELRALFFLEHAIRDGKPDASGERRVVSRRLQFVEISEGGAERDAGYAPYLDYRPLRDEEEAAAVARLLEASAWVRQDLEPAAMTYAVRHLVPAHLGEVRSARTELVTKTIAAVKDRLTKEINHWDHRAVELAERERAGKAVGDRLNSARARQRADELSARLTKRMQELELELQISPLPPVVAGGALVIPAGLLAELLGAAGVPDHAARETRRVELAAMAAVIEAERALGFEPQDVSAQKVGYDVESRVPGTGRLRFIEVKGRISGATTVTVTKNEIITALNKPDDFILALVEVNGSAALPRYVRTPFGREPDFGVTSVTYDLKELLARAGEPS